MGSSVAQLRSIDPSIQRNRLLTLLIGITNSLKNDLTFAQKVELTLPVIPFLLEYKIELGAGIDLQTFWEELQNRIQKLEN